MAGDLSAAVASVCTNSRRMDGQSLFVALRGERFDGHDFLPQAAAGGAVAALVATPTPSLPCIQVADTRRALGKLAQFVRQGLTGKVIAVAGSNGKTGTKLLIDAALRSKLRGTVSPKSYNNDIGVPLTILPADPNQDYLVLEMGTNHHGEIQRLSEMATPDIVVITNCGAEHLEFLGDLRGVRGLARSTIRNYSLSAASFCRYVTDPAYGWAEECLTRFGTHPVQVVHEWNTAVHVQDNESDAKKRAFTRAELHAFFEHCDNEVARARAFGRVDEGGAPPHPSQIRMCRFPASGSSWESLARGCVGDTIRDSSSPEASKGGGPPSVAFSPGQLSVAVSYTGL